MSCPPRVYLIDGYSNIFRAYYAIRGLSSSHGEPTNAVYGFLQMLRKLLRDEQPRYLGVALDVSADTVRRDRFEDYKAHRAPMPDDLRPQIRWIRKLLEAYGVPLLELPRYEADDVLGTLARKAVAEGYEVVLVSPDKDLFQLVGDGVFQFHTTRDKLYDAAGIEADFGVPPAQVVDVLALVGDASDNVPGVPGIGDKGAKKLIAEYGSLDALIEHAGEIRRKSYREGLERHREQALLSRDLVTIHTDLDIEFTPESLRLSEPDLAALRGICWQLDFRSLAKEYEEGAGLESEALPASVEVRFAEDWRGRLAGVAGEIHVGVVGEPALGLAVSAGDGEPLWCDFRSRDLEEAARLSLESWLGDTGVELVGHDLKEVLRLFAPRGPQIRCRLFDTMLGSYLARSALRSHDLDAVAQDRLQRSAMSVRDAGFRRGVRPLAGDGQLLAYAGERVALPQRMAPGLRAELEEAGLTEVYRRIEEPLLRVLADVEETGVLLDVAFLQTMSAKMAGDIEALEEQIYDQAGERFNINSPAQLGEIMFERLGYPVLKKTRKTKAYSTDAAILEELAARGYPLPETVLRYRELMKLKSTYVDALPALVAEDGRLHTRFNQAVAATGRLSSASPNLQNIPIRTEQGHLIRKAFRAPPEHLLLVADYNQIELRVLAHVAGEEAMIEAFRNGEDIHAATAAAVFGGSPVLVNPDQRRMAKVINFGIIYGMSAFGLATRLGIDRKDAKRFIDAYMERYPGVRRYTEETVARALETARVETLYGRIRHLPDIHSRNYAMRENAKRMAINAPIQGTAADLLKLAMIAVDGRLRRQLPEARLLLTVHDELVLEAPAAAVDRLGEVVREEMEGVAELAVPLKVDLGSGPTWYDAKG